MKATKKIIAIALLALSMPVLASQNGIQVISTYSQVLFFKTDKEWVGANVKVKNAEGALVFEEVTEKRKVLIDFYDLAPGSYTIIITHDDSIEEITYVNP